MVSLRIVGLIIVDTWSLPMSAGYLGISSPGKGLKHFEKLHFEGVDYLWTLNSHGVEQTPQKKPWQERSRFIRMAKLLPQLITIPSCVNSFSRSDLGIPPRLCTLVTVSGGIPRWLWWRYKLPSFRSELDPPGLDSAYGFH